MVSNLVINQNTYVSLATASAYLADSPRTTAWAFLDPDTQNRSLIAAAREIDKQRYLGTLTALQILNTAGVGAAGTTYVAGDRVTVGIGVGVQAYAGVVTVGGSGEVQSIRLDQAGLYTSIPSSPAATTTSGSGTGFTMSLTTKTQVMTFPRTGLIDAEGNAVNANTIPSEVENAQIEYAFELSQEPELEGSSGTGDNNKVLQAGSVRVERFRPLTGTRFPNIVQEFLRPFFDSFGSVTPPFAPGVTAESRFDDADFYKLDRGFA